MLLSENERKIVQGINEDMFTSVLDYLEHLAFHTKMNYRLNAFSNNYHIDTMSGAKSIPQNI
jgi:hypothetical protein